METFWWRQWAQLDNLGSLWVSPCRWFKEELPGPRPPELFSVCSRFIVSPQSVNHLFILANSCCRSILSSAKHPSRCSTGSTYRLWRFWSRLVSFTFHKRVNLHCTNKREKLDWRMGANVSEVAVNWDSGCWAKYFEMKLTNSPNATTQSVALIECVRAIAPKSSPNSAECIFHRPHKAESSREGIERVKKVVFDISRPTAPMHKFIFSGESIWSLNSSW